MTPHNNPHHNNPIRCHTVWCITIYCSALQLYTVYCSTNHHCFHDLLTLYWICTSPRNHCECRYQKASSIFYTITSTPFNTRPVPSHPLRFPEAICRPHRRCSGRMLHSAGALCAFAIYKDVQEIATLGEQRWRRPRLCHRPFPSNGTQRPNITQYLNSECTARQAVITALTVPADVRRQIT